MGLVLLLSAALGPPRRACSLLLGVDMLNVLFWRIWARRANACVSLCHLRRDFEPETLREGRGSAVFLIGTPKIADLVLRVPFIGVQSPSAPTISATVDLLWIVTENGSRASPVDAAIAWRRLWMQNCSCQAPAGTLEPVPPHSSSTVLTSHTAAHHRS